MRCKGLQGITRSFSFSFCTPQFAYIEKFSLNFSNSSFVIRVNLLHPLPSLFLYGLSLSLWCFSILLNCYFQVSNHLKVILYVAKLTQNTVTEPFWYYVHAEFISSMYSVSNIKMNTTLHQKIIPALEVA